MKTLSCLFFISLFLTSCLPKIENLEDLEELELVVYAGGNKEVILPANSITLHARIIGDYGTVSEIRWAKISGPDQGEMSGTDSNKLSLSNLAEGAYQFEVVVKSSTSKIFRDTAFVDVKTAPSVEIISKDANFAIQDLGSQFNSQFEIIIDATPSSLTMDSLISFADAADSYDFNALAGMVRFNPDGKIDARDGDKYVLGSDIPYQQAKSHRFRILADIPRKKYDAYVTLPGSSSENLIASGLNFRTSQQSVSQISKVVLWSRPEELKVKLISAKAISHDLVPPEVMAPPKVNQAPTVSAGIDRAIILPENSVQIMASASDSDGSITSYSWSKVSGPSQVSVSGANSPTLGLSNLAQGNYVYRIVITDNEGAIAEDRISIVVNPAPISDLISRDANLVIHDLSGVFNARFELIFDATPATLTMESLISFSDAAEEYNFNSLAGIVRFNTYGKIDARDGDNYIPGNDLSYLQAKSHRFRLLADIATKKYDAYVTLPGSSSETLIASGLNFRTSQQSVSKISKLVLWSRFEELKVKLISANAVSKNLLPPEVEPPKVNQAPTVSVENNKEITLPTNSVQVSASASDSDGSIASYNWAKVSGPSQVSASGANTANLSLSNLAQGNYVYRVVVTDNQGATSEDSVSILVNPQVQDAPTQGRIDVPSLTVIKLPLDSASITASVQTPNGVILSYDWVRVSGPTSPRTYGKALKTLTFYDLVEGEYVWRINVKYTSNDTLTKTFKLIVQPADSTTSGNVASFMSYYLGLMKAEYRYSSTTAERSTVSRWSQEIRSNGSWADIDYGAGQDAMGRVKRMAQTWATPGHEFYQSNTIKQQVLQAVRYWCYGGYYTKHSNWYVRDISSPFNLIPAVVHFWNDFTAADKVEIKKALSIRAGHRMTGANAINIAERDMIRAIMYNEPVVLNNSILWIKDLLRRDFTSQYYGIDGREGMTPDDGFMQHGDVFYLGGYGTDFINPMAKFFKIFSGTMYDFNDEQYASFEGLILNGYRSYFRGQTLDYFVSGRSKTKSSFENYKTSVAKVADLMSQTRTSRKTEFQQFRDSILQNKPLQLSKNKVFFSSDTVAHMRPKFNTSIHMFSQRVYNNDGAIFGESRRSHNIKDGSMLTFQTGKEYVGILPVWDWNRIPGTTTCHVDLSDTKELRAFGLTKHVGGVSDGVNGMAAMDFIKPIVSYHLSAKKAWFLFDEGVVALGTDIKGVDCPREMETVVEQNFAISSVANLSNGIHHGNTAYIPLGTTKIQHEVKAQSGSYFYVNENGGSKTVLTKNVFTASIDHGQNPMNASYAYIVAPGTTLTAAQSMSQSSLGISYVNNSTVQAVYLAKTKTIMATFYKAGTLNIAGRILKVDRPTTIMVKTQNREFLVSDPIQSQTFVNVGYTDENSASYKKQILFPEGLMVGSTASLKY
jgi:chondroitin AC lyase